MEPPNLLRRLRFLELRRTYGDRHAPDAVAKLASLKKIDSSWQRETFVRDGKWALIGKEQDSGVIDSCAAELYKL